MEFEERIDQGNIQQLDVSTLEGPVHKEIETDYFAPSIEGNFMGEIFSEKEEQKRQRIQTELLLLQNAQQNDPNSEQSEALWSYLYMRAEVHIRGMTHRGLTTQDYDSVQESVINIYRHLISNNFLLDNALTYKHGISALVARIVTNKFIDHKRQDQRRQKEVPIDLSDPSDLSLSDWEKSAEELEMLSILLSYCNTERESTWLICKYEYGLPTRKIQELFPQLFPTKKLVDNTQRNLRDRLLRQGKIKLLLQEIGITIQQSEDII